MPSDEEAWNIVYRGLWPTVFATAYRILSGDRAEAEDVAQTVFIRLVRGDTINRIRDEIHLRAYLAKMARLTAIDHLRMRYTAKRDTILLDTFVDPGVSPEISLERDDLLEKMGQKLSVPDQQLLEFLLHGYSGAEIAGQLGITHVAVRVRLHRLRQRLAAYLTNDL
jgi:RNA polymerase sigma factor (sigma-70 family)